MISSVSVASTKYVSGKTRPSRLLLPSGWFSERTRPLVAASRNFSAERPDSLPTRSAICFSVKPSGIVSRSKVFVGPALSCAMTEPIDDFFCSEYTPASRSLAGCSFKYTLKIRALVITPLSSRIAAIVALRGTFGNRDRDGLAGRPGGFTWRWYQTTCPRPARRTR